MNLAGERIWFAPNEIPDCLAPMMSFMFHIGTTNVVRGDDLCYWNQRHCSRLDFLGSPISHWVNIIYQFMLKRMRTIFIGGRMQTCKCC